MAPPPSSPTKSHVKSSTDNLKDGINIVYHGQSQLEGGGPGTPRLARTLSRKNSMREEKISIVCSVEGVKGSDHPSKGRQAGYLRLLFPFGSSDTMSLPVVSPSQRNSNEPGTPRSLKDATDGHFGRHKHIASFDPRKIVFLCATVSCMGTIMLIYLTLRLRKSTEGEFQ